MPAMTNETMTDGTGLGDRFSQHEEDTGADRRADAEHGQFEGAEARA